MKISDLIKELEKLQKLHGDIEVKTHSLSHAWEPDLTVKNKDTTYSYVLLNS